MSVTGKKTTTTVFDDYIAQNPEMENVVKGTGTMPSTATAEQGAIANAYQTAYANQQAINRRADNAIYDANKAHDLAQKYLDVQNKANGLGGLGVADTSAIRLSSQYQSALSAANEARETSLSDNYTTLQDRVDTIRGEWDAKRYQTATNNILNFTDWGSASAYLKSLGFAEGSGTYNEFKAQWQGYKNTEITNEILGFEDRSDALGYLEKYGITQESNPDAFNSIMNEWDMQYTVQASKAKDINLISTDYNYTVKNIKYAKDTDNFSIVFDIGNGMSHTYHVKHGGVSEEVTSIIQTLPKDLRSKMTEGTVFQYDGKWYVMDDGYNAYSIVNRGNGNSFTNFKNSNYVQGLNSLYSGSGSGNSGSEVGSGAITLGGDLKRKEDGSWIYVLNGTEYSCGYNGDTPPEIIERDGKVYAKFKQDGLPFGEFLEYEIGQKSSAPTPETPTPETPTPETPTTASKASANNLFTFNTDGAKLDGKVGENFSIKGPDNKKYRIELGASSEEASSEASNSGIGDKEIFEYNGELYIKFGLTAYRIKGRALWGEAQYEELKKAWKANANDGVIDGTKAAQAVTDATFNNNGGFRTNFRDGDNFSVKIGDTKYRVQSGGEVTDSKIINAANAAKIGDGQIFKYGKKDESGNVAAQSGDLYLKKDGRIYKVEQRDMGAPTQRKQYTELYGKAYSGEDVTAAQSAGVKVLDNIKFNRNGGWTFFGASDFRDGDNFSVKIGDTKYRVQSGGEVSENDPVIAAAETLGNYRIFSYDEKTYIKVNGKVYGVEIRDAKSNRHASMYDELYSNLVGNTSGDVGEGVKTSGVVTLNKNNKFLFFGANDFRSGDNFSVKIGDTKYRVQSGGEVSDSTIIEKAKGVGNKQFFGYENGIYYKEYGRIYKVEMREAGSNRHNMHYGTVWSQLFGGDNADNTLSGETSVKALYTEEENGKELDVENSGHASQNFKKGDNFKIKYGNTTYKVESGGVTKDKTVVYLASQIEKANAVFLYNDEVYYKAGNVVYKVEARPISNKGFDDLKKALNGVTGKKVNSQTESQKE